LGKEAEMQLERVLIVSDSPDRKAFLEFHVKGLKLRPIWYPNILAARMAARSDPFVLIIVDLNIPMEPKLALINDCIRWQAETMVVSIGKTEYLMKEKPLPEVSSVVSLSSIKSVPVLIKEWVDRGR